MSRPCEVCASLSQDQRKTRRLLVGERIVSLCDEHAESVRNADPGNLEELRELFPEPDGRRSLLGRRSPLDRRIFPPRPEGRRRSEGRRHDDAS
ncbi:MAG: hypothetical protein KC776_01345 [Myxococcales bacterium]|nr:hypothetical protein [Myxococcales bacterium]MCB9583259.1 hypothetical protein [Polyangiaceae bacterium]